MTITLYKTADNVNKVSKSLTDGINLSGKAVDNCNVLQPDLIIEYYPGLALYNYCYIPVFNRYYFMQVTGISGNHATISCKVDSLMSYASAILKCSATVIRGGFGSTDIADSKLPISDRTWIDSYMLDTSKPNNNYYYAVTLYGGD